MKKKPDESTRVYGAGVLLKHIAAMLAEVEGVRQARDIEYIHRMRVASRRLRTALNLFPDSLPAKKLEGWSRDIRRVTKSLGAARDTDVQIELLQNILAEHREPVYRPGLRRLLLRTMQTRQKLQEDVNQALDRLIASQTLTRMQAALNPLVEKQGEVFLYSPALYQRAADHVLRGLDDFLIHEDDIVYPERVEELHAMRISAKHLRYALEAFAPLYPDELKSFIQNMRKIQDTLGEIHDCDVWELILPQFVEKERARVLAYFGSLRPASRLTAGIEFFRQNRRELRQQKYQSFLSDWKKITAKCVWENLRKVVESPLYPVVEEAQAPAEKAAPAVPEETPPVPPAVEEGSEAK